MAHLRAIIGVTIVFGGNYSEEHTVCFQWKHEIKFSMWGGWVDFNRLAYLTVFFSM